MCIDSVAALFLFLLLWRSARHDWKCCRSEHAAIDILAVCPNFRGSAATTSAGHADSYASCTICWWYAGWCTQFATTTGVSNGCQGYRDSVAGAGSARYQRACADEATQLPDFIDDILRLTPKSFVRHCCWLPLFHCLGGSSRADR